MYSTKQRIIEASVRLFNENGMDSVRLQQIAEEVGISIGNLAYHYKNKEMIVASVYEQVIEEFNEILRQYLANPTLADFDSQISQYYHFFLRNHFFLPEFFKNNRTQLQHQAEWQACIRKMNIQIRSRLGFMVVQGYLSPETSDELYDVLSEQIWMSIAFFVPKCNLTGQPSDEGAYKKCVWGLIKPHFTAHGKQEFYNLIQSYWWI